MAIETQLQFVSLTNTYAEVNTSTGAAPVITSNANKIELQPTPAVQSYTYAYPIG